MGRTIVAVATAYGQGSISIIRLSGPKSLALGLTLSKKSQLTPRHAYFTTFLNSKNELIDEGILLYFKAPHSYTGEDVVEFQIHGGVIASKLLLDELLRAGATLAKPGEFSKLACLNGKMDLIKALSIQELINAKSEGQAKLILRNIQGELQALIGGVRSSLIKSLAFIEASIDYADELPDDTLSELYQLCETNAKLLDKLVRTSKLKKGLIKGFKIALIGKPNVGKSSLLNALLAYDRAIISSTPGTTRDLIEEELIIGSHIVRITDTAGLRKTKDEIEAKGVKLSLKSLKEADIILAVFDASKTTDDADKSLLKELSSTNAKVFYVLNKLDLPCIFDTKLLGKNLIKLDKDKDLAKLFTTLEDYLNTQDSKDLLLSNTGLILACENAAKHLFQAYLEKDELEFFAFWINKALEDLAFFGQDYQHSELLDAMFSSFCLGK